MREIKFRGKRLDFNEWIIGFLITTWCGKYYIFPIDEIQNKAYIENISYVPGRIRLKAIEVDPKTVGQFTGLRDRNGREIYEGDIVHLSSKDGIDYNAVIQFIDGGFCATDGIEDYACKRYCLSYFDLDVEVVGNIYDNPELSTR